jgi:hypothetical protein
MVQIFSLPDVMEFLGHAHVGTTAIYLHYRPKVDAAEKLSRLVAETTTLATLEKVA